MESQLKRGLIEDCVMAAIRKQDSYGYQIIKDISPYLSISESTLYPILKRLESNGNLTVYSIEHNGRLRKYYQITQAGMDKIEDFKQEWNKLQKAYDFITGEEIA